MDNAAVSGNREPQKASSLKVTFKFDKESWFIGVHHASVTFLGYPKDGLSTKDHRLKICLLPMLVIFVQWSRSFPSRIDPRLRAKFDEWQAANRRAS